jgi:flavocytochrome c
MSDYDVLVIGSGAAGLCAALEAALAGASVLVAESQDVIGGSSRLSGGMIMGAGTRFQKALGIEDTPNDLYKDYMLLNQWKVEPALVRRLADTAGPSIEWLSDLGVEYHEQLIFGGDEKVPRTHVPNTLGAGVVDVLTGECKRHDAIEFALRRRVNRLLTDHGRVVGAAVDGDEVTAGAVVVATGGFGANPAMLGRYYPEAASAGDWGWYIGAPGAQGDAIHLAEQVGAQVIGQNRGLVLLTPNFSRSLEVYVPGWLVFVNREGHRFCDETAPYGLVGGLVNAQPGPVYAIFDEASRQAAQPDEQAAYKQQVPGEEIQAQNWVAPTIEEMATKGVVKQAATIEELATAIGILPGALAGTVERYNEGVARGEDLDYLKLPDLMRPISTPPFYAAEIRPAIVCLTSTGLRIDAQARVLDRAGRPIAGLFAAGECTGGVLGERYMGSGNSYANCVVFGRVAGRSATAGAAAVEALAGAPGDE